MRSHATLKNRTIQDVIGVVVPEAIDPTDPVQRADLIKQLEVLSREVVDMQYVEPPGLTFEKMEFLITNDAEEVERFQPDHDCERCRAGNITAKEFLAHHPERYVALGNLTYTEDWG